MRKTISLLSAMILCLGMALTVFGTEFVPSITYKPTPGLGEATLVIPLHPQETRPEGGPVEEKEEVHVSGCIVITSITQAEEKTTDITQEDRDLLLDVYAKLSDGSMDLFSIPEEYFENQQTEPAGTAAPGETAAAPGTEAPETPTHSNMGLSYQDKNYVVVQLVDVSFAKMQCIDDGHGHKEILAREDVNATLEFDLGVSADAVVVVLHFHDGKWIPVTNTVNNGDGTVTCEFEHFCPVAFCIEAEGLEAPQQEDFSWLIWLVLLVVCAGLVALLVIYREKNKKKKNTEE